jgi:hypothetical protein
MEMRHVRISGSGRLVNAAVKVKALVEHRLGEVLAETVKHEGGRPEKNCDTVSQLIPEEITRKQSSRAQQLAKIPWEDIERGIEVRTQANERASQSRITKELR